ncbi:hypothetical protein LaPh949_gp044 [Lactococcus phage 949]|uniref:Uncharacterized protein n=1 Tax=Lactococcus phage 949 TaxID=881953 RepID=E0YIT1_9CAUD|nr:hypothetical protein LaPh949_gp044 [Lactococcus phage 949]ADM73602.1 hypothetical protein [Lactococcus phage 949]
MFKKRITRLIISIVSYLFLIGTYWISPTVEMGNNIFKNIAILLVGQPISIIFVIGCIAMFIIFFEFITYAIIYAIFTWIMNGNK